MIDELKRALLTAKAIGEEIDRKLPYSPTDPYEGYDRTHIIRLIGRPSFEKGMAQAVSESYTENATRLKSSNPQGAVVEIARGKKVGEKAIVIGEIEGKNMVMGLRSRPAYEVWEQPLRSCRPIPTPVVMGDEIKRLRNPIVIKGNKLTNTRDRRERVRHAYYGEGMIIGLALLKAYIPCVAVLFEGESCEIWVPLAELS
jgi:hypothetical protein